MASIDQAALEAVQDDIKAIAEATEKAELELTLKRNELMLPIYEKRREVIARIPKFWSAVMQNHRGLSELIEEVDLPVLEHLTDLWVKHDTKDARSYEIIFTFKENPYFTNKELIKKITLKDDEPVSETFEINWKEGKDLTAKDPSKKRKKGDNEDDASDSFFVWFKDEDIHLGDFFVQEIFPEALRQVNIYAGVDDDEVDFEEEEDDASVDLEDEEDDEEEEDEDEEEKPSKKKNKK
ncbi:hypothetical protein BGZ65_006326 [Modicella reniformis]|uniref:Template-activating factor I n=1 Tax=Modicella reniformis TaxID=1440133 RepID=A0A9P6J939_9FUNG|nr:hypothetical protein BGZ65_006326 [Modicella reniformis]